MLRHPFLLLTGGGNKLFVLKHMSNSLNIRFLFMDTFISFLFSISRPEHVHFSIAWHFICHLNGISGSCQFSVYRMS